MGSGRAGRFEDVDEACDIGSHVRCGILGGVPYPGLRRQGQDVRDLVLLQDVVEEVALVVCLEYVDASFFRISMGARLMPTG